MELLVRLRAAWTKVSVLVGTVLVRIGGLLLVLALGFAGHSWEWARHRVRSEATVVENVAQFAPGGGVVYVPRIRFRAGNGELVQLLSGPAKDDPEFDPGEIVPVLYPAGDEKDAVIATVWRLYFWAILFAIAGTVLFDVGLVIKRL